MLATKICSALAGELRDVRHEAERLAELMFGDEQFVMLHLDRLQNLDLLMQRVSEAATLLDRLAEGTCDEAAVGDIRLQSMQERLRTVLLAA